MLSLNMEVNLFLSIVNMKLRNDYASLEALCDDFDLNPNDVKAKLIEIDYVYVEGQNQFRSI